MALVSLHPIHLPCWHQFIFLKLTSLETPQAFRYKVQTSQPALHGPSPAHVSHQPPFPYLALLSAEGLPLYNPVTRLCPLSSLFYFIYLFLAALGLRCCTQAFSSCGEQGLLFVEVRGLLITVVSLVAEHGL